MRLNCIGNQRNVLLVSKLARCRVPMCRPNDLCAGSASQPSTHAAIHTHTWFGNNPLCGREVIFRLDIVTVRDATEEEIELGGPVGADPDISEIVGSDQTVKPIS